MYGLMLACLLGIGYGYWGAFTMSGQKVYDEMAAMTPFFVLMASCFVLTILVILWVVKKIRQNW